MPRSILSGINEAFYGKENSLICLFVFFLNEKCRWLFKSRPFCPFFLHLVSQSHSHHHDATSSNSCSRNSPVTKSEIFQPLKTDK